jgi:molybdenum cofactor cytidylyltransferase
MTATRAFPFGCVVLAAGAGTRFGEPKAGAIVRDGVRFIDAVVETARLAGADPIVVVVPAGFAAPTGTRVVVNADATGEQIKSVRLGLAQLTNSAAAGALLWPVDHPFVRLESALAVLDAAKRTGAPIVIPTYDGQRGHPAWFVRDTWRELVTVADGGARAVVRAYGSRVNEVAVTDAGVVRDVDTPADLAAAQAGARDG